MADGESKTPIRTHYPVMVWVGVWIFLATLVTVIAFDGPVRTLTLVVSLATLVVGSLVGFLFAIPRVEAARRTANDANTPGSGSDKTRYLTNTALEQISDWLTKIMVGVGLVQFQAIGAWLRRAADSFKGTVLNPSADVLFLCMVTIHLIAGFLMFYLWTRIHFSGILAVYDEIAQLRRQLSESEQRAANDAAALKAAEDQLTGNEALSREGLAAMNQAIAAASENVRRAIFHRARAFRIAQSAGGERTQHLLTRAVPVFEALNGADGYKVHHQNYGQIAFILEASGKLAEAIEELNSAINIRNKARVSGFSHYELARARCRLKLWLQAAPNPSESLPTSVTADLEAYDDKPENILKDNVDGSFAAWVQANITRLKTKRS